jgi:D-alanine-D-alanine ligase
MASAVDKRPARELRILVLHNRDFDSEPAPGTAQTAADLERVARADVLNAAQHITRALAAHGHFVEVQGIDIEDLGDLMNQLRRDRPDLVFNLCESLGGDDHHEVVVPTLLDVLGIPYTGSGPFSMALCRDKFRAKQLLRAASIPTPLAAKLPAQKRPRAEDLAAVDSIGYPLFLKLGEADGSVGISSASIVRSDEEFLHQLDALRKQYQQTVLAERFVDGRELYVSMIGNAPQRLLPLQEIDFSRLPKDLPQIVSENAKWNPGTPEYEAISSMAVGPLPKAVQARVLEVAQKSFALLDVWDYGRCDMRLSDDGTPYVIEMNPNCDLCDGAGFSRAAALAGLSYDQVIAEIASVAHQRNANVRRKRQDAGPSSDRS